MKEVPHYFTEGIVLLKQQRALRTEVVVWESGQRQAFTCDPRNNMPDKHQDIVQNGYDVLIPCLLLTTPETLYERRN